MCKIHSMVSKSHVAVTICNTTGSVKGTSSVKTLELPLGDMSSRTLMPLALQSATDKTSEGKVMFISATSEANGPSSTLNIRSPGTVSERKRGEKSNEGSLQ